MSLNRYIASAPTGALPLHCLQLSHPDWPSVHRRVSQPDDYELTLETAAVVTFQGWKAVGNWESPFPKLDDAGVVTRSLRVSDVHHELRDQLREVRDSEDPVSCVIRFYTSDDLTAPKIVSEYQVYDWRYAGGELSISVRSLNLTEMRWPRDRHTDANTPGWRGRW